MDPKSQEKLEQLLTTDPALYNKQDVEFVRARRDYLTPDQKRIVKAVLTGPLPGEEAEVEKPQPHPQAEPTVPTPAEVIVNPEPQAPVEPEAPVEAPAEQTQAEVAPETPAEAVADVTPETQETAVDAEDPEDEYSDVSAGSADPDTTPQG